MSQTGFSSPRPLSPAPVQQGQSESVAAPAAAVQGQGTIKCAACGSTNTESCCHPAEFCQAICNNCNAPLNADGSLWVEKVEPTLDQFQRWLETEAHKANAIFDEAQVSGSTLDKLRWDLGQRVARCRAATKMLMEYKRGLRA